MPLDTDVGLGPSDIVLDGDPAPASPKRGYSPQFSAKRLRLVDQFGAPLQISTGFASWRRYCTASSIVGVSVEQRALYSAGQPSRWALARISSLL